MSLHVCMWLRLDVQVCGAVRMRYGTGVTTQTGAAGAPGRVPLSVGEVYYDLLATSQPRMGFISGSTDGTHVSVGLCRYEAG